ncbi:VOC family protein [Chitinilyticum litopenaei]|uniref:VOC family protein n=1 Tax=Chitinilyticum litopenaei TaxID=1121276 RepID=UPI00040D0BA4|nr:VOC family protein [Chitinilyticum litopenaei]
MSIRLGAIRQIAFVVEDIDEAMRHWTQVIGVGPFFIKRQITLADFVYRGEPSQSPTISIALANSGELQIELIQQHDHTPSLYLEFLQQGKRGLQHVSSWLSRADMERKKSQLLAEGMRIAQQGTIAASGVRLIYLDTETADGPVFELADLDEPEHHPRLHRIRDAGTNWNGQNPVIEVNQ